MKMAKGAGVTGTALGVRGYSGHSMTSVGEDIYIFTRDGLFKYSTTSRIWTKLDADADATGTPPSTQFHHSMTTVGQDVYVFGGFSGETSGVEARIRQRKGA